MIPIVDAASVDFIASIGAPITPIALAYGTSLRAVKHKYVPLDIDVFPMDNSGTKKEGVSIPAATAAGPGSDLADGQPATGTVTFAANDTTPRQFTIATRNDARDEGAETFTVTLSEDDDGDNPLPDGVSIPSAGAAPETPCV